MAIHDPNLTDLDLLAGVLGPEGVAAADRVTLRREELLREDCGS
ncbi:MAG TPA: hypothetical protein VKX16_00940 [Chloroflexota bacterium]|nr:hypothetical protein [Chloroflexota bacterium]